MTGRCMGAMQRGRGLVFMTRGPELLIFWLVCLVLPQTWVELGNESIELGNESIVTLTMLSLGYLTLRLRCSQCRTMRSLPNPNHGTISSLVSVVVSTGLFVSHFVHFYTLEYFRPFLPELLSVVSIVHFLGPYLVTKH